MDIISAVMDYISQISFKSKKIHKATEAYKTQWHALGNSGWQCKVYIIVAVDYL